MRAPGPAEVCQLRCSGRGERELDPPRRRPAEPAGSTGSPQHTGSAGSRRAGPGGLPRDTARFSALSPTVPAGPCYDELVAPLYSSSIGASSRYNIFYSASFARLHSESPPRTRVQTGRGAMGKWCTQQGLASCGAEGSSGAHGRALSISQGRGRAPQPSSSHPQ